MVVRDREHDGRLPNNNQTKVGPLEVKHRNPDLSTALHLLHRAGQCADDLFAAATAGSDLTPRQFAVLKAVAATQSPSQTTLVEMTGIDRSTLADIVRRLVEKKLLQRRRTREDARTYAVRLTDKGQAALATTEPAARATEDRLLASIPASERQAFLQSLCSIVEAIGPVAGARVSKG